MVVCMEKGSASVGRAHGVVVGMQCILTLAWVRRGAQGRVEKGDAHPYPRIGGEQARAIVCMVGGGVCMWEGERVLEGEESAHARCSTAW